MIRIHLVVEGQTEETFVRDLLDPYYSPRGIYFNSIALRTSPGHKGGLTSYERAKHHVLIKCKEDRTAFVSTLFDLYALPKDFPGKTSDQYPVQGTGHQKAQFLEQQLLQDINKANFIPNLVVHEFEGMLFSDTARFTDWFDFNPKALKELDAIARVHANPEEINDGPMTAPSKRILRLLPEYQKTFHGPQIAKAIGLDALREKCSHLNSWLVKLERLNQP